MTGDATDEQLVAAVRGSVAEELERLGQRGALRAEGSWLVLGKGATQSRAQVHGTLEQWQNLPDDLRQRRARQLAELLLSQRAAPPAAPPQRRLSNRPSWLSVIAPVVVATMTAIAVLLAYRVLAPNGNSTWASLAGLLRGTPATSPASTPSADLARQPAVPGVSPCDRVRARIARGASIGPADVEGWQVELVLLRRGAALDLSRSHALSSFLHPKSGSTASTWIWPNAKSLILLQRYDAQVEVQALPPLGTAQLSGVSIEFSGPYVTPFFSQELRSDYSLLADALAEALGATDGALFAHCEKQETHAVGAWFLGTSPGAALGALVYFMAAFSDTPVLKPEILGSGDEGTRHRQAFDAIDRAASGVDRQRSATLIGRELGMISGSPNKPSRLTFPFRDANRAQRASVEVARVLGLASNR